MTSKMLIAVAGLAAFAAYSFQRGRQAQAAKARVKEDLTRWEGEGGNVPSVATPSPAPQPLSSHPEAQSQPRH